MNPNKISDQIRKSKYISRDLSWLRFNYRVLDQVKDASKSIFDRLKFLAITSSNLDEFFMIRVGSLYNYIDYGKERVDYSGLRELPFRKKLFELAHRFVIDAYSTYNNDLVPLFNKNGFDICKIDNLTEVEQKKADRYFKDTIYPLLTPMMYDNYHGFPLLMNQILIFGVVTKTSDENKLQQRLTFVQIPQNLARFFEIQRKDKIIFVPIEEVIRWRIGKLFRNVEIVSIDLFRITRNGDFTLEESDDIDADFIQEIKLKLKTRKKGRVVRLEVEKNPSPYMMKVLKERWAIDNNNIFPVNNLIDLKGLWQIIKHNHFKDKLFRQPSPVPPFSLPIEEANENLFDYLKEHDVLLHHPFNSIEPVVSLLEKAAEDPYVLGIKQTIYRLADQSRVSAALLKAAENGKNVSVLFEVKARFDEERNIKEGERLEKAGCFVIYGVSKYKTHTKMMMIIRKEGEKVTRYVHIGSGNYNEQTSKLYTDISLLTTNETYAHDVSEFFNVITGHSLPNDYEYLITAPKDMRLQMAELIRTEARNARRGLPSGIVMKMNSLEDKEIIDELYRASKAGVPIKLIVRGICCLRPGRKSLSENISVSSIVGEYLEHTRLFYFHNNNEPKILGGSADMMVRSFDRRIEALFLIVDEELKKEATTILKYNLRDNKNTYVMREDGAYIKKQDSDEVFNLHQEFYKLTPEKLEDSVSLHQYLQQQTIIPASPKAYKNHGDEDSDLTTDDELDVEDEPELPEEELEVASNAESQAGLE
ncbi:polyphosphate kinase 1 [Adhaeribacter pallidiroseus]|uniref:Polyphosphate kinase n=1 Tax=Adhaeribacter pallidiroseus TaxID=2072847 RepID=A0A369QJR0_9BACT|nr:polyphosphate kinase 1 [Adhaeribacter pallidiroseus]RDC65173.1 Polyphosphate kinase [Adhaeribacter pallidiroseus]